MPVLAGVSDAAIAVRDRLRGKIGLTRVMRYRRGMFPEWASDLDGDDQSIPHAASVLDSVSPRRHSAARDDCRCVRLHEEVVESVAGVEVVVEPRDAEATAAAEDDEAQEERRRRIRERWLLREREEEELLPKEDEEVPTDMESDSESEFEAHSGEEETCIAVVKPVFVAKQRRETVVERAEERRVLEELVRRRMEERKVKTRRIVVEVIIKEEHLEKTQNEEPTADIDTDDNTDEAKEYEAWKNREIERIRKDRDARLTKGEAEKVRNVTGEKRMECEAGNPKPVPLAKRKKMMKFMQRYHHRGAFFQEKHDDGSQMSGLDDVYKRD
ncbi:microfibrillar-associated protein 1-like [Panicum virgatum]|uniref:Micro-fibrillar-associated protein 1 C-terminal domain-containing protein n=1 Tax=Panicum virgatum TaxID=38727 RepID=A0A8T0TS51_PANVG|nr:microfibrillar-associated protein 1-like [Panicum virgatum]KAG2611654.1 hypothetical protein PVAP13_4KG182200 [Panicum virgatum]